MTPALKLALAYCRATGQFPAHIRLDTWSAGYKLIVPGHIPYVLTDEAKAATDDHPLWLAVQYLTARGFRKRSGIGKLTSHYIAFIHPDHEWEALAFRNGGGSITRTIRAEGSGVFIRNETERFALADTMK